MNGQAYSITRNITNHNIHHDRQRFLLNSLIHYRNQNGKQLIHFAAQLCPDLGVLNYLVRALECDVSSTTTRGHTPLIFACSRGREDSVLFLVEENADLLVRTVSGDSALSMAEGRVGEGVLEKLRDEERR